jgi:hypothetical protein
MGTRRFAAAICAAVAAAGLSTSVALAGEVKGPPYQGAPVPGGIGDTGIRDETAAVNNGHASLCAYSGLNDYDSTLGQTDRKTQTPKDAGPGSAAHGWTITIPGVGEVTISCNKNGPVP